MKLDCRDNLAAVLTVLLSAEPALCRHDITWCCLDGRPRKDGGTSKPNQKLRSNIKGFGAVNSELPWVFLIVDGPSEYQAKQLSEGQWEITKE